MTKILGFEITRPSKLLKDSIEIPEEGADDGIFDDPKFFNELGVRSERDRTVLTILEKLKERYEDRKKRFEEYRLISKDSVVGGAVELMSDDATQFDIERERTVWVESDDKEFEKEINGILQLYVEPFIDSIASSILSFGEFAFRVVTDKKSTKDKEKKYPMVLLPFRKIEKLHHLILENYSHWYAVTENLSKVKGELEIKKDTEFIHFINYSIENSTEIEIKLREGKDKPVKQPVFVLSGESVLTDKVVEDYRILKTLEDAIIATRLDKSKMIRFINVEVAKMDNTKAANVVNYIDSLLNKNESISKEQDVYRASKIQAQPVNIVLPIKQDKGRVTIEESATNVDIKDIVDIEYFQNRLFAGLRTPKEYLGFGTEPGGFPGPSAASLMRMDIRYSRTVKKVQRVLVLGVEDIIRVYANLKKIKEENVPKHKVKVIQTTSAEEEERYMEIEQRITMASGLFEQILDPETGQIDIQRVDLLIKFYTEVVPITSMAQFLKDLKKGVGVDSKPEELETV